MASLQLFDTQGREVMRQSLGYDRGLSKHPLPTSAFPRGLYVVVLDGRLAGKVLLGE